MGVVLFWFPDDGEDVVGGQLATVSTLGLSAAATLFVSEGVAFRPDLSGYHSADARGEGPQLTPTGLEPQPDPAKTFVSKDSVFAPEDGEFVTPQTAATGLEPQPDLDKGFVNKESAFAPGAVGDATPTTAPSGVDPQPDPPRVFEDKESGSEEPPV